MNCTANNTPGSIPKLPFVAATYPIIGGRAPAHDKELSSHHSKYDMNGGQLNVFDKGELEALEDERQMRTASVAGTANAAASRLAIADKDDEYIGEANRNK